MKADLQRRILSCPTLPSLPAVALRLVRLCEAPEVDARQIVETLSEDEVLASKVLRVANSAAFARGKVSTLSRAALFLGSNAILTIALSFSVVRARTRNGFDLHAHWKRALFAALAARAMADRSGVSGEVAFLAGLMQDLGMLALHEVEPVAYGEIVGASRGDHHRLAQLELERLGADHAAVTALLLRHWNLPEELPEAVLASHEAPAGPDGAIPPLAGCVYLSGRLADVFLHPRPSDALALAVDAARGQMGVDLDAISWLLSRVATQASEVGDDFEIELGDPEAVLAVVDQARTALVRACLRAGLPGCGVPAQHDPLTGALLRPSLDAALGEVFAAALRANRSLGLAVVRVDHLARHVERVGRAGGERLLAEVAGTVQGCIRECDLPARLEDDLVIVLPGTPEAGAAVVAERIRSRVASASYPVLAALGLQATVSVGLSTHGPGSPYESGAALLKASLARAEEAAAAGGDRVVQPASPPETAGRA